MTRVRAPLTFTTNEKNDALIEFASSDILSSDRNRPLEYLIDTLVNEPDSLFSLLTLTKKRILSKISVIENYIEDLTNCANSLYTKKQDLSNVDYLDNARVTASSVRSSQTKAGLSKLSRRIRESSSNLLNNVGYYSYSEARSLSKDRLNKLNNEVTALNKCLDNLSTSLTNLRSSNIGKVLAEEKIGKIASSIEDIAEEMESISEDERSKIARLSALRLLAADSKLNDIVKEVTTGDPRLTQEPSASPLYRIVASGTGTAPQITGDVSEPWPIESGSSTLTFDDLNGSTFSVDLLGSHNGVENAELTGTVEGPFNISSDIATPPALQSSIETFNIVAGTSDQLYIKVDSTTFRVTLTDGAAVTAATVANDINVSTAGSRVTASVVSSKVQIDYDMIPSIPSSYSARKLEIVSSQGGYSVTNEATDLQNWRSTTSGNPTGTRSIGWDANDKLRIQANDSRNYTEVTLPSGSWPNYSVNTGAVGSGGTVVDSIHNAAVAAGENFTSSNSGDYVVISSSEVGEGSIVTIRGGSNVSNRGAKTLGFNIDQEDRCTDISVSIVKKSLENSSSFSERGYIDNELVRYIEGQGEVNGGTSFGISYDTDPIGDLPSPSEVKLSVNAQDGYGTYNVSSYNYFAGTLYFIVDREIRDPDSTKVWLSLYKSHLLIGSLDNSTTGSIDVSGSVASVVGLPTTAFLSTVNYLTVYENTDLYGWKQKDLTKLHINKQDLVKENDNTIIDSITSVDNDGTLTIDSGVEADFSRDTVGFVISSYSFNEYKELLNAISNLDKLDTSDIDSSFYQLYSNKSRSSANYSTTLLSNFSSLLDSYESAVNSFNPISIDAVSLIVSALQESGLDNAVKNVKDADINALLRDEGSTMDVVRNAASEVRKLIGDEEVRNKVRAVWIDEVEDKIEEEDDILYKPEIWGDEEI